MADRCYYSYTIPLDENGQPLIIHQSDRYVICHAFDKDANNVVLKIATDTYFANAQEEVRKAYERAKLAMEFSRHEDCNACCKIYDAELNNEDFYVAMQYVKGISFATILVNIDIIENHGDLDALETQLSIIGTKLSDAGIRQSTLCAENIFLSTDTDGIVLLNYTALPDDENFVCDDPAKEFVDRIRNTKIEERNRILAEFQARELRKRKTKRLMWLLGIISGFALIILYLFSATSVPRQLAARWKYDEVESVGSVFRVKSDGKYGVLSAEYKEIIPVSYEAVEIDARHPNSFIVHKQGLSGVYHTGLQKEAIAIQYDSITWKENSVFQVYKSGNSLLADASQSQFIYYPTDFKVYASENLKGYRDVFGSVLIEAIFDDVKPFIKTDFFAAAAQKGKWGVIDGRGKFIISPNYDEIRPCKDVSAAKQNGHWGYVENIKNKQIGRFQYTKVDDWSKEMSNTGRVYMGNRSMFLGRDGQYRYRDEDMVISSAGASFLVTDQFGNTMFYTSKIDHMYEYSCGRARVRIDGVFTDDYGYVDYQGNVIIPIKYSEASDFEDGKAVVAEGTLFRDRMEIDVNGKVIREL